MGVAGSKARTRLPGLGFYVPFLISSQMATEAPNSRLETFCDGVFAIALTLLVLEFKTPDSGTIQSAADLWRALGRMWPSLMAFLLSFAIILISWVNHHAFMKAIDRPATPAFVYANGFLLLSIVLFPFPTALLAQFALTDAATPAVVVYTLANWAQNVGWLLMTGAALRPEPLSSSRGALAAVKEARKQAKMAFFVYPVCVTAAFWFPKTVAAFFALLWCGWVIYGITPRQDE